MNLTKRRNSLYLLIKTRISSKGQTTVPRRFLKLWKTSQVLWDLNPDGTARVSPTPDIMALMGSIAQAVHAGTMKKQRPAPRLAGTQRKKGFQNEPARPSGCKRHFALSPQ